MTMSQVLQRQSIHYTGSMGLLNHLLRQLSGRVETMEEQKLQIFGVIDLTLENKVVTLEVRTHKYSN
jgi:cleavage and polyadenylation specificity factor subunit 3